jgi:hypothetical protein
MKHLSRFDESIVEGKYKIKYTYDSGDSENNEYDLEGVIELNLLTI